MLSRVERRPQKHRHLSILRSLCRRRAALCVRTYLGLSALTVTSDDNSRTPPSSHSSAATVRDKLPAARSCSPACGRLISAECAVAGLCSLDGDTAPASVVNKPRSDASPPLITQPSLLSTGDCAHRPLRTAPVLRIDTVRFSSVSARALSSSTVSGYRCRTLFAIHNKHHSYRGCVSNKQ